MNARASSSNAEAEILFGRARDSLLSEALADLLSPPDELFLDASWTAAQERVRAYCLRPGKRVRPALFLAGYAIARGKVELSDELNRFAAALELLHAFLLVHDDIADKAETRRGGPTLHRMLADGRLGEDLGVVIGDHLFTRAIEGMLTSGVPNAAPAVATMLKVLRHTAAGQFLDLRLAQLPLREVTVFQTLKVAQLKTARYAFAAPLALGATIGGGGEEVVSSLEKIGRQAGVAFQLRDDILGLFGDDATAGKPGGGDFIEGKRTFPVAAAYTRADEQGRRALEALWEAPIKDSTLLSDARREVERLGGLLATERVIARVTRRARKSLDLLPGPGIAHVFLDQLFERLQERVS